MYKKGKTVYNKIIFTDIEKEDIKNKYLNGLSTVKIGDQYRVSHKIIARVLDEYGIPRTGTSKRKYNLNEEYFNKIDTPNKAYIFGLLYADGNNNLSKYTVSISLEEQDKHILESIRKELKSDKELEYLDYSNKHDFGYTYKNQYRLLFFSKKICESLFEKGMYQNKSLILEFPNWLNDDLKRHFVRGYFDGDGSYCPHFSKNGKFQPLITFTSTNNFCIDLQKYLIKSINIPCGNIYDASCHNGITKVLSFSGRLQVKTFLNWLYNDAEMYLERKYKKYIESLPYLNNSFVA